MRLLTLVAIAILTTTLLPLAAAEPICVGPPGRSDLACVGFIRNGPMQDGVCVQESTNPPYPGTWQASTTCVPVKCPEWLCAPGDPLPDLRAEKLAEEILEMVQ